MNNRTSPASLKAIRKYDRKNTKGLYLKLNLKTDSDIIDFMETKENKQGYIKKLIRADMQRKG